MHLGTLAGSLSFHLKRTDAIVFQHFNSHVPRSRMVRGEVAILMLVRANPGLNQESVGRAVGLEKSTISAAITRLRKRNLIEQRSTDDKRVRRLHLTAAGRSFLQRLVPLVDQHEAEIASGLDVDQRQQLIELLQRVFEIVSRIK